MPTITYDGDFGGVLAGKNGRSIQVTGEALPSDAFINSIEYTLDMSAQIASSRYEWCLHWFAIGSTSGSPKATYKEVTMSSDDYTFSGKMNFSQSDVSKFTSGRFTLYAKANSNQDETQQTYMRRFTITVTYNEEEPDDDETGGDSGGGGSGGGSEYVPPKAYQPTALELSQYTAAPGASVTLSWAGTVVNDSNYRIASYEVRRCASPLNPSALANYTRNYRIVETSETYGSCTVEAPPDIGAEYYYCVMAKLEPSGTVAMVGGVTYVTLKASVSAVEAPTEIKVGAENAAPGAKVTLSWSGAAHGASNDIRGYEIYRATDAAGPYTLLTTVSSSTTTGEVIVVAPTVNGMPYYYKVRTLGTIAGYDYSEMSVVYATLRCSYGVTGAPTSVSVSATNVAPGAEVTLMWSGASAGANNTIVGYEIFRENSETGSIAPVNAVNSTETSGSCLVTAPTDPEIIYYYRVRTLGYDDDSSGAPSAAFASLSCVISSPVAPTAVTVNGRSGIDVPSGTAVTLAWSEANAGVNNPVIGYTVYRDGVVYVTDLSDMTFDCSVESPTEAGSAYSYTVVANGAYRDSVESKAVVVRVYSDPTAPASLAVSNDTPSPGARVRLSWSGAAAGVLNQITGYKVYRATSESGTKVQISSVSAADTHASCYVLAPSRVGESYYFWVETVGVYSASGPSAACVSICAGEATEGEDESTSVVVPPAAGYLKRGFVFGDYDTAQNGWTLTGWSFPEPETQTNYLDVPGRIGGPLDLSTALTDGDPRFGSRTLTATFECSDGTRLERDDLIHDMANQIHGVSLEITFPDDTARYAVGRVRVNTEYSDPAHAAVTVTAVCEPWRYDKQETCISFTAVEGVNSVVLTNGGRCLLVPEIIVSGLGASVRLSYDKYTWVFNAGTYRDPDLTLPRGNTLLTYSGYGTVTIKYREADI